MSYSPKSIAEKVKQEKLAEQLRRKADEDRVKSEKRAKTEESAKKRKADFEFYDGIARKLLEAAIAGQTDMCFERFEVDAYEDVLIASGFAISREGEFSIEDLIDTFPEFKPKYGALLAEREAKRSARLDAEAEARSDLEDEIQEMYELARVAHLTCINDLCTTIHEEEVGKHIGAVLKSGTISKSPNGKALEGVVSKLEQLYEYFRSRPKLKRSSSEAYEALSNIQSSLKELPDLLSSYKSQDDDISEDDDTESYFINQVDWADPDSDRCNSRHPFFTSTFFHWLASDKGKSFTNAAFSLIKKSMASGSSDCTLDFEVKQHKSVTEYDPDYDDEEPDYSLVNLYFKGVCLDTTATIEAIESMFSCLGYRLKLAKQKDSKKYQLQVAWEKVTP
jgi:hypothetical protein